MRAFKSAEIDKYIEFEQLTLGEIKAEKISGKNDMNIYFTECEKYYHANIKEFYCRAFILYHRFPGIFQDSLFKNSYLKLKEYKDEEIPLIYDYFKKDKNNFLVTCQKLEKIPFFIKRFGIKDSLLYLVADSFRADIQSQMHRELSLIKTILKEHPDINIYQETITVPKMVESKIWQLKHNPYIQSNEISGTVLVNKKPVITSMTNVIVWNHLVRTTELLTIYKNNKSSYHSIAGYDEVHYKDLVGLVNSFCSNEFVKQHLESYLTDKINKSKSNKSWWQNAKLNLMLEEKAPTKLQKI